MIICFIINKVIYIYIAIIITIMDIDVGKCVKVLDIQHKITLIKIN